MAGQFLLLKYTLISYIRTGHCDGIFHFWENVIVRMKRQSLQLIFRNHAIRIWF